MNERREGDSQKYSQERLRVKEYIQAKFGESQQISSRYQMVNGLGFSPADEHVFTWYLTEQSLSEASSKHTSSPLWGMLERNPESRVIKLLTRNLVRDYAAAKSVRYGIPSIEEMYRKSALKEDSGVITTEERVNRRLLDISRAAQALYTEYSKNKLKSTSAIIEKLDERKKSIIIMSL